MGISKVFDTGSSLRRVFHTVDPTRPIGIKWAELGGEPITGRALSDELPLDDGFGRIQLFVRGAILWSPAFGAVYMSEAVWRKWSSPSVERYRLPTGQTLQSYLGYPIEDTTHRFSAGGAVEWAYFERGMIYTSPQGSSVVYGEIYLHYRILGGFEGFLGTPITDEKPAPGGGRVSRFAFGDIYHHARTGAREVHGAIAERYRQLGGPADVLGYPVSDEETIRGPRGEIGRFNRFENGSGIYWSAATGAWEVYGAVWVRWMDTGGPSGKLGLPTSGETDTPYSGGRYNEFEHGVVVWHGAGPAAGAWAVLDLQLIISRYAVDDDFNVQVHVTATPSEVNHGRMPADGEFDGGVKDFNPPLIMVDIARVRADSKITVWLEAISQRNIGKDARKGIVTAEYTVDNAWGLLDTDFDHRNGAFTATMRVRPATVETVSDPQLLFWPFRNTDTFKLSWETYARTFRDVNERDKHLSFNPFDFSLHPWEIFLYEAFYNNLAQAGFCFGACLESIYARDQRSLFIEPIETNPFNPYQRNHPVTPTPGPLDPARPGDGVTLDEVNVKHGYQIGAGMIEFFLSRWTAGALHDPERAYRESYADFQADNWPMLTVSDEDAFSQDHGHALLPYKWDPPPDQIAHSFPRQPLIIYVKNPNFPTAPQNDRHCRIEIDRLTWKWTYRHGDDELWSGSESGGGRLLAIPFTELNARPVTPGYAVASLLAAGVYLIFGGDGATQQITDGYGRTFFHYPSVAADNPLGLYRLPVRQINWDSATRIPNLMEVPMFGAPAASKAAHAQGIASSGTTVDTGGAGRRLVQPLPELYYHRPGPAPKGVARLTTQATREIAAIGSQRGAVTNATVASPLSPQDELHFELRGKGTGRMWWHASAARMSAAVVIDAEPGAVDSVVLGGAGGHFQSVTVQLPHAKVPRSVSMTITGWRGLDRRQVKSFVLEGLSLGSTDTVRVQMSDGGRDLVIENHGPARTFDLRVVAGLDAQTIASRTGVVLEPASVVRLRPETWAIASVGARIHLEVLDSTGQKVLRSAML